MGSILMKNKWILQYWDHDSDCEKKVSFSTYEEAITKATKVKNKWGSNNIKISLKGAPK